MRPGVAAGASPSEWSVRWSVRCAPPGLGGPRSQRGGEDGRLKARSAQPPRRQGRVVPATDKGAAAVLYRLAEVAKMRVLASKQGELAANQVQLREAAKARRAELRQVRIAAKARELGHEVDVSEEGDITCRKCGKCAKADSRTAALGNRCAEGFPSELHVTHRPHYRCVEGIHVCCKCGKFTRKRWLGLRKPCANPTAGGRAVLRRLEKGISPLAS